jgi:hypothetical protein
MRGKEEMSQEAVVDKIAKMGQVVAILHTVSETGGMMPPVNEDSYSPPILFGTFPFGSLPIPLLLALFGYIPSYSF